jgi:Flp pilus assembly protein TadG
MRLASRRVVHFRRAQKGATAIEFALVAIPFFFVLGSIIELGVMLAKEYTLQNAVQDAGRTIRTGNAGAMSGDQFRQEVCNQGAAVRDCATTLGIAVQSGATFSNLSVPDVANIGPGIQSYNSGGPGEAVAVVATHDWQFILPFMGFFFSNLPDGDARRLHGIAVFRNEPT